MREWKTIKEYEDILFDYYNGIAKITINSATPSTIAASARTSTWWP